MDKSILKIIGFIVVVIALTAIFKFVTREQLDPPDESRRVRHPDGYSFVAPKDWAGSVLQAGKIKYPMLKFVPETNVGVQPSLLVSRNDKPYELPGGKEVRDSARPIQFQGQPATYYEGIEQNVWMYAIDFQRGSDYYRISLKLAVHEEVMRGNWWKYFETFRLETALTTQPTSMPALVVPKRD